jgi:hypothetical protein
MAMKLLPFHDQSIPYFPADDQDDDLVSLNTVQDTEITRPQFELGQRIGSQTLDGLGERGGLVEKPGLDGRFQGPLFTHG